MAIYINHHAILANVLVLNQWIIQNGNQQAAGPAEPGRLRSAIQFLISTCGDRQPSDELSSVVGHGASTTS